MKKQLDITNIKEAKEKITDIKVFGDGNLFRLMSKASSESGEWMKSTKVMEIPKVGCVLQVTTQQGQNVAEALEYIPFVKVEEDESGNLKLVSIYSLKSTEEK